MQILRKKIVARELDQAFSNTQVEVIWTATMENGSLLKADFTEATVAQAATATYVINDYSVGDNGMQVPSIGEAVQVNAITFGAKLYAADLKASDGAVSAATVVTALAAKQIELV
jgi:hypothetical protein